MSDGINNQLVLIAGYSGTGKSASLRNIRNQEDWLYCGTEAGKRLPFQNTFKNKGGYRITNPMQVMDAFAAGTNNPAIKGICIDSLNFLMDQYESQMVLPSANTMKAWGDYGQFFKELMQQKVVDFDRPTIFMAHNADTLDETSMEVKTAVPIKGAIGKGSGVEAYFSTVIYARKVQIKDLVGFENDLLTITDDEKEDGFKHVFQTRVTKTTMGGRIRSPMGMFSRKETFIDNDAQAVLDRLHAFYNGK